MVLSVERTSVDFSLNAAGSSDGMDMSLCSVVWCGNLHNIHFTGINYIGIDPREEKSAHTFRLSARLPNDSTFSVTSRFASPRLDSGNIRIMLECLALHSQERTAMAEEKDKIKEEAFTYCCCFPYKPEDEEIERLAKSRVKKMSFALTATDHEKIDAIVATYLK